MLVACVGSGFRSEFYTEVLGIDYLWSSTRRTFGRLAGKLRHFADFYFIWNNVKEGV